MSATGQRVHDVILRGGRTLRLRPPAEGDADGVRRFLTELSPASMRMRFHGTRRVDDAMVESFLDPDWIDEGILLATGVGEDESDRVIGIAGFTRLRDPSAAEVSFIVAEDRQSDWIATRLLERLADEAGRAGIERFIAEVLPENRPMLRVFEDSGFTVSRTDDGGEIRVEFPIRSDERYREAVDLRDHRAVGPSLRPVLAPSAVAVVGASAKEGSIGGAIFSNIVEAGYTGSVFPVNRSGEPVAGHAAHASVAELPVPVDLAVIAVPSGAVHSAVAEALGAGAKALCVISAGFAETGPAGAQAEAELLALVRSHGARMVGPNCLGVFAAGVRMNATFSRRQFDPGNVAISSQSGAVGLAVIDEASQRGLGLSAFVSVGNKADVSSNDLLEYWEDDEETDAIALYLESFGNPRRFARIANRVARVKPILALKSGSTTMGERAAMSHTAALAGSDVAAEALFRQAGVLRAHTLQELCDVLHLVATQPLPHGRRVAILSNAGGLAILCADACAELGFELAPLSEHTRQHLAAMLPDEATVANPVDMIASATSETFAAVVPLLLADTDVDALIVLAAPTSLAMPEDVVRAIGEACERDGATKPVLAVTPGTTPQAGAVPAYRYPEAAAGALARAVERAEWLRRPHGRVHEPVVDREAAQAVVDAALEASPDAWLAAGPARRLLTAYGVPCVTQRTVTNRPEALEAAHALGYPLAVKMGEAGVHKIDRGGVILGVSDVPALDAALDRIGYPAVLQPMVSGGIELLAGVVQDPVFGPVVAFGPGGTMAELIGGTAFATLPLTDVDAAELVTSGKAGELVTGFRGRPAADVNALVDLVVRLAALAEDFPQVAELDLNPVIALADDCVAVDSRVRIAHAAPQGRLKSW
jgi:acyl-CoA synthetase (NDP forming)/RimJ/RimL family protein N-acetyltransferase